MGATLVSVPVLFPFDRGDQLRTNMHHSYYRSYIAIFLVLLSLNIGIHASENTTENANSETVSGIFRIIFCSKIFYKIKMSAI